MWLPLHLWEDFSFFESSFFFFVFFNLSKDKKKKRMTFQPVLLRHFWHKRNSRILQRLNFCSCYKSIHSLYCFTLINMLNTIHSYAIIFVLYIEICQLGGVMLLQYFVAVCNGPTCIYSIFKSLILINQPVVLWVSDGLKCSPSVTIDFQQYTCHLMPFHIILACFRP